MARQRASRLRSAARHRTRLDPPRLHIARLDSAAQPRVLRGASRLARGWSGALAMTLLAALFHSAATHGASSPSLGALALSTVLAAPLCTALAGRAFSLWRTVAAVLGAQGIFHTLYGVSAGAATVRVAPGAGPGGDALGAHAGHLDVASAAQGPLLAVSDAAEGASHAVHDGPGMLAAHLAAALLTVVVLRWGEAAVVAAVERVLEATGLTRLPRGPLPLPAPLRVAALHAPRPVAALVLIGTPGRRGPPLALAA